MSDIRSVFIAGGGSGLGFAVAELLASRVWRVEIAGRNGGGLDAALARLPTSACGHVLDVAGAAATVSAVNGFHPDVWATVPMFWARARCSAN